MRARYDNCNKVITEHLKRGEHVHCRCKKVMGKEIFTNRTIVAFIDDQDNDLYYYLDSRGEGVDWAEKIEYETRMLNIVDMAKALVRHNCKPKNDGSFRDKKGECMFFATDWMSCGEIITQQTRRLPSWMFVKLAI